MIYRGIFVLGCGFHIGPLYFMPNGIILYSGFLARNNGLLKKKIGFYMAKVKHPRSGDSALGDKPLIQQRKRGRPRSEIEMVHTAVVLPRGLLDDLRKSAAAHNWGVSAEVRAQLEQYDMARQRRRSSDAETEVLLSAIKRLSEFLARDTGAKWYQHPYALAAFKAGVEALLGRYHLDGDERIRPDTQGAGKPDDPPETVGRTHARRIQIKHPDEGEPPEQPDVFESD
jgi:hypothetical protein